MTALSASPARTGNTALTQSSSLVADARLRSPGGIPHTGHRLLKIYCTKYAYVYTQVMNKKVLLNQYIREDQKKALESQATKLNVSMGEIVRRALDAYLNLKEKR